ncbi:MAG: hypothetical protein ACFFDN_44570 [Candidatus Hodarchaeota archaeon]
MINNGEVMKDRHFEKLFHIISWIGYFLTLGLSIYAVKKIYNAESTEWFIAALFTGIVVNTAEILALYVWNKNKKEAKYLEHKMSTVYIDRDRNYLASLLKDRQHFLPIAFFFFFASLSIVGSFVAFHTGYKRGEKISQIQDQIVNQLALSEGIITQYKSNAEEAKRQAQSKRWLSRMYLDKSNDFLIKAENLLGKNSKDLDYLKETLENTVALNLYQAYSSLFGGNTLFWAAFFNIFVAILIETAMAFAQTYSYKISNPKAFIAELGEKESTGKLVIDPQGKLKEQGKEKKFVKDSNNGKSKTKIFAGKEKNVKSQINYNNSLRKEIVKAWYAQLGEIEQGIREKTNMTEIANKFNCERQNVHYHLKQEGLI